MQISIYRKPENLNLKLLCKPLRLHFCSKLDKDLEIIKTVKILSFEGDLDKL